jgi:predicted DNA-binding protein with PD1-like motif
MKTAVEFYREELNALVSLRETKFKTEQEIFEQAKAMEKEQIKDAWDNGCGYVQENSQQYYNETFKQQEQ